VYGLKICDGQRPAPGRPQSRAIRRGGHFAAMEEPAIYVEDVRAFFRTLR
jgi:hypothetical protein